MPASTEPRRAGARLAACLPSPDGATDDAAHLAASRPGGDVKALFARLPAVERVVSSPSAAPLIERYGRARVVDAVRRGLDAWRDAARLAAEPASVPDIDDVLGAVARQLETDDACRLRPVFNFTGTVLHTNLGRALLPEEAVEAVASALVHPVNVEFDLVRGRRGERDDAVEGLLCELTGAQAATVVNNNAAAVLLMLSALAAKKEVIVSRGELVEIGGSFRIPDIMRAAGAKLREVGTTNRTHCVDYEAALGARTALAMKVHCSNYAVVGFTASVPIGELAQAMHVRGVPVAVDLGSGTLVDLARWGLPSEPTVREAVAAGADLVTFSGDKLLGGPQAGLIVGRADLVARIRKHPLRRALRVCKMTLAALEAILRLYRAPERLAERLATLRLLTRPPDEIRLCAERMAPALCRALGDAYRVDVRAMTSQIGSGALPVDRLPSYGLAVHPLQGKRGERSLARLQTALRAWPRPVLGRIADGMLYFDLRCLEAREEPEFVALCNRAAERRA